MNPPEREPGRKHLPHLAPLEFPNQTILQFVTVCVQERRPLLTRPEIVQLLLDCWRKAGHWLVGRYVVMPDHLHLFCAPGQFPATPLKRWAQFWRNESTRRWPAPDEKPVWQPDFFDRQRRSGESHHQKWLYVWNNPVRAGLVHRAADWPFQGELNVLPWHEPVERSQGVAELRPPRI
jgi:putative transposase